MDSGVGWAGIEVCLLSLNYMFKKVNIANIIYSFIYYVYKFNSKSSVTYDL